MSATPYASHMPPQREARIAGFCYLLVIAGGVFAALFVREALYVPADAASTAGAIAAREMLWRWGIAVHLLLWQPRRTGSCPNRLDSRTSRRLPFTLRA